MKVIQSLILIGAVSCASIHDGKYAKQVDQNGNTIKSKTTGFGIKVSGKEVSSLSSKHFTMIDFTFENTTNEWVKIDSINLDYGSAILNKAVKVPVGKQLQIWAEAAQQNKQIDQHNAQVAASIVLATGTIAAGASHDNGLQAIGTGAMAASFGALTYQELQAKLDQVELARTVPNSHLLNETFYIPPGLHTKKWITIYLKEPYEVPFLKGIKISYNATRGQKNLGNEKVSLQLRKSTVFSDFQNDHAFVKARKEKVRKNQKLRL